MVIERLDFERGGAVGLVFMDASAFDDSVARASSASLPRGAALMTTAQDALAALAISTVEAMASKSKRAGRQGISTRSASRATIAASAFE